MMSASARRHDQRLEITLLQERSAGTFARVYLAEARGSGGLSRVVAVKVIKEQWSDSAEILSRSRDEARLLSRLQHRNILRVEALAWVDGQPALVMEYVDGVDLRELILGLAEQGRRVPARSAYTVLASAASALAAAYEEVPLTMSGPLRVVHRDIKPSNIMISRQGEVKVLDFGTARFDLTERQAKTGAMRFGSLKYMSPERRDGERGDHPSDVYALGLVALELLRCELLPVLPARADEHDRLLAGMIDRLDGLGLPDARWDDALRQTLRGMVAADPARRLHASQVVPLFRSFSDNATGQSLETFASTVVAALGQAPRRDLSAEISGSRVFTAATTSSDLPPPSTGNPRLGARVAAVADPATIDEPRSLAAPASSAQARFTVEPVDADTPGPGHGRRGADRPAQAPRRGPTTTPVRAGEPLPVRAAPDAQRHDRRGHDPRGHDPRGHDPAGHAAPTAAAFADPISVTRPSSPSWPRPELAGAAATPDLATDSPPPAARTPHPTATLPHGTPEPTPRQRSNLFVGVVTAAVVFIAGGLLIAFATAALAMWWYFGQADRPAASSGAATVDAEAPADDASAPAADPALAVVAGAGATVTLRSDDEMLQWTAIEDADGRRLFKGSPDGRVELPPGDYTLRVKMRARSAVATTLPVHGDLALTCRSAPKGTVTCATDDGGELLLAP